MNFEISPTRDFLVEAKKLKKRYRSFENDLEDFKDSLQKNPYQGAELCPGIRKIRMAIVDEDHGRIALLTIYDKQDADTVDLRVIKKMAQELGFCVE